MTEPVDIKLTRDEKREQAKRLVLAFLTTMPSFKRACAEAEINVTTLRKWRHEDAEFDAQCDEARRVGFEALEDEAVERGIFKGSDRLLMFMLQGYRPSIFGRHATPPESEDQPLVLQWAREK